MFEIVSNFEKQVAEFYGAPFAVATDSCTHAMELCLRLEQQNKITVPTRTYISVPFLAQKLNLEWVWDDAEWKDYYFLGESKILLL